MATIQEQERSVETAGRRGAFKGYGGEGEMPLAGYAALVGLYYVAAGAFSVLVRRTEKALPERPHFADILLLGVGTHKLSRLITKDWVTSPLRAPFTEYKGSAGAGEVREKSRGAGLRRAVGDLVTCPWCTGAWVAAFMGYGLVLAPRATRFIAGVLAIETISDFLHIGYDTAKKLER